MTFAEHPSHLVVGHLNKAHGTRGEVFLWPLTDHPGSHFAPGVLLFLDGPDDGEPSADVPPLRIEAVRGYRKGFLVRFEGYEDRTSAETLTGRYVLRPFEEIDELDDGEVFYHELLGATVVTPGGETVGTVQEVYPTRSGDLLEVARDGGSVMIPVIPEVVVAFDRARGAVVIDPPPGLLEL